MIRHKAFLLTSASLLLSGALVVAPAMAAEASDNASSNPANAASTGRATTGAAASDTTAKNNSGDKQEVKQLVDEAVKVANKMTSDPQLKKLMAKAKGIYIVPEFGRGAVIVGGRGGAGVVLAKHNGQWTDPAFYDFGAISFGAQVGGSGGAVAFLLMTQGAVDQFMSGNNISLNAESGLTIINYSADAQASWGKGDIIFWSNTSGAYAGATVSLTDLNWDDDSNQAYYGKKVDASAILTGQVTAQKATELKNALPG